MPIVPDDPDAIPLHVLEAEGLSRWLEAADPMARAWVSGQGFKAGLGEVICVPQSDGAMSCVLVGWGNASARKRDRFHLAGVADRLPPQRYRLVVDTGANLDAELEALGWGLGQYRFDRYRSNDAPQPDLICPDGVDAARLSAIERGATLCLDLINTPARDMGPAALETRFRDVASAFGAKARVVSGMDALEAQNFPMIAAVGAAAVQAPRLLDMTWGRAGAPCVTLVGKGVCFDTGGLNIKPGGSMGLMKKDMGGAGTALGLAHMIMELDLDLRLRVVIPAVENAISGPAFRPGDILSSRKGLTVEVNNTDAEGRLVLADALALADEENPDLVISLATLTGAARVALGPDVPPFFTDDESMAAALASSAEKVADPLWRLPFWEPYETMIEPGIADLDNAPKGGMAGAITAALFLRRFVQNSGSYIHFDIYGWTPGPKPGRPKGAAFQAARALLDMLETRYCNRS